MSRRQTSSLRLVVLIIVAFVFLMALLLIHFLHLQPLHPSSELQPQNLDQLKNSMGFHLRTSEFREDFHMPLKDGTLLIKGKEKEATVPFPSLETFTHREHKKVAFAITVTKDSPFIDGALVLGFAAKKTHNGNTSLYEADLVAFVTPGVSSAIPILQKHGWKVLVKPLPVELNEIENKEYMERMRDSGCCGADEFLKLWAYTLVDYHRVVHLDMDSIVFKNMDELFAIDKELLYAGDYNMQAGSPAVPVQGGFLVIKPSMARFEEFQRIIRKGDFGPKGWGGTCL